MRLDINCDDDSKTCIYKIERGMSGSLKYTQTHTHTHNTIKVFDMNNFVLGDKMRAKFIPTLSRE